MRENRSSGSEGGEALRLSYPYEPARSEFQTYEALFPKISATRGAK